VLSPLKSGVKACVEITIYPDGYAGIALSEIDDSPRPRTIVQRDALPLNDLDELRDHVLAVIDHVADRVGSETADRNP
jgi:hypothetical protein